MKNTKPLVITAISLFVVIILMIGGIIYLSKTEKNTVNIYFMKKVGQQEFVMKPVKRIFSGENSKISFVINELLKAPTEEEQKQGYYSEIPPETKLIAITEDSKEVVINLSKDFESFGGSTSMSYRYKQLVNTALNAEKKKPVFLELNGKRVNYIGGEGVLVNQPLSK